MATKRKVKKYADGSDMGDFAGVDEAVARNSDSGEWARGENYGDNTTGDERVAMARAPARGASAEEVMAANKFATATKPNIVTKEQLAKSGFTNLRDYMNALQGLTRRGGGAPERATSAAKEVKADIKDQVKANKAESVMRQKPSAVTAESYDPDKINFGATKVAPKKEDEPKKSSSLGMSQRSRPYADSFKKPAKREPLPTASDQAYKKGGMTASKRADGIAVRGKTRGKMC